MVDIYMYVCTQSNVWVSTANPEMLHVDLHVQWKVHCHAFSTPQYQKTALHYASEEGHRETVQMLLEKGTDLSAQECVSLCV